MDILAFSDGWTGSNKLFLGNPCKNNHQWANSGKPLKKRNGQCIACQYEELARRKRLLADDGIDPNKYRLVNLCDKKHEWNNTGLSIASIKAQCQECDRLRWLKRRGQPLDTPKKVAPYIPLDNEFFLGVLCCNGHEYQNTGLTKRSVKTRHCPDCDRLQNKKWNKKNPERRKEINNKSYWNRIEKIRKIQELKRKHPKPRKIEGMPNHYLGRLCKRSHVYQNTGLCLRYKASKECVICSGIDNKEWMDLNKEKRREYMRLYSKTSKGRMARIRGCSLYRARMQKNHNFIHSKESLQNLLEIFKNKCAWCNQDFCDSNKAFFDHFIPISKGGENTVSNLVPSCRSCNSSKRAKDPLDWFSNQKFYSNKRWCFILKTLGRSDNYLQMTLL